MNESRKPQNEDQLDALVRELAAGSNEPPGDLDAERRERIFARVRAARTPATRRRFRAPRPSVRTWTQVAAMAAVLVIGIGIGRWNPPTPAPDSAVAVDPTRADRQTVYRFAARAYLERTENLLLTLQRAAYSPDPNTPWGTATAEPTVGWAHDLLRETRLLQDSPAVQDDPQLAQLLDDLELLLAQIVQAAGRHPDGAAVDPSTLQRVRTELERSPVLQDDEI